MTKRQETWKHLVGIAVISNRYFMKRGHDNETRYSSITFIWQDEKHKLHEQRHDVDDEQVTGWIRDWIAAGVYCLKEEEHRSFYKPLCTYYAGTMTRKSWTKSQVYAVARYCRRQMTDRYASVSDISKATIKALAKCGVLREKGYSNYELQLEHPHVVEQLAAMEDTMVAEREAYVVAKTKTHGNAELAQEIVTKIAGSYDMTGLIYHIESGRPGSVSIHIASKLDLGNDYRGEPRLSPSDITHGGLRINCYTRNDAQEISLKWGLQRNSSFDMDAITRRMEMLMLAQDIAIELMQVDLQ